MPTITMAEAVKLQQNTLLKGVVQTILTTDKLFQYLPFIDIPGSITWNKESVLGDVQVLGVGGTITATNPATVTQATASLTTIVGQAEVNGLIQATRSNTNDQRGYQIFSKAKSAGRQFRNMLINGTGLSDQFPGLLSLVVPGQTLAVGANGGNLTFAHLDSLMSLVKSKDGVVDFFSMPERTKNGFLELSRTANGAGLLEVINQPDNTQLLKYRGVPILVNDNIPINQTQGTSTDCTTVFAGCFDDGTNQVGVAGLTAPGDAFGLKVKHIGEHQTKDESIDRVIWYCGATCFNDYGLAAIKGVRN